MTALFFVLMASLAIAAEAPPVFDGSPASNEESRYRPAVGAAGMVVSDDPIANEWGGEILRKGGNAVDAAVATAFMLSVTRPHYGSLGGGGFLLYCAPGKPECGAIAADPRGEGNAVAE